MAPLPGAEVAGPEGAAVPLELVRAPFAAPEERGAPVGAAVPEVAWECPSSEWEWPSSPCEWPPSVPLVGAAGAPVAPETPEGAAAVPVAFGALVAAAPLMAAFEAARLVHIFLSVSPIEAPRAWSNAPAEIAQVRQLSTSAHLSSCR